MTEAQATKPQAATDDGAFTALEQELGTLLRRARALSAEMGREVHPGLDPEAYGLLAGVHDCSWARASERALRFGLGEATVSRQLKVPAQLGPIEREPDPDDGRPARPLQPPVRRRATDLRNGRQPLHPHEQPFGQEQLDPCPHEQLRIMPPACDAAARTARQTMVTRRG